MKVVSMHTSSKNKGQYGYFSHGQGSTMYGEL